MVINPGTLTFSDYLKQLSSEFLLNTFLPHEGGKRRVVSSSMIEEIATTFSSEEEIKKRFFNLPLEHQLRCGWMYLMRERGINALNSNAVFQDPLVSSFLGYAARREEELRIFGFSNFERHLKSELATILVENSSEKLTSPFTLKYEFSYVNDIIVVLSFASRKLLVKKKSGKIATNILQQIKKLIHVHQFYENSDIEIIVKSIIEYCKSKELIEELDDKYIVSHTAISYWLKREPEKIASEIKEFFTKDIIGWDIELLLRICENAEGVWLRIPSFSQEDERYIREGLVLLDLINIIEIKKYKNEIYFQIAKTRPSPTADEKTHRIVIMPDFSLLIREECLLEEFYIINCFSKLTTLDQIYHGKISKESITTALAECIEIESILSILNIYNTPSNVMVSVKEWIYEFLRLSLCKKNTLLVTDKKTGEQIALCDELKPFLKEIPVVTLFVIKEGAEEKVERILKDKGFDIRMPVINYFEEQLLSSSFKNKYFDKEESEWSLIVENEETKENTKVVIKGSKYSSELKKLELSETIQVIDYAILTSQKLIFSYEGSSYIKKGIYTVIPLRCSKGTEPILEGELERTGSRKQFYVRKIDSIGVI